MASKYFLTYLQLIPIMLTFLATGFVDLVGIAGNYVKVDFQLSNYTANLCASMVFIWFLVCAPPSGIIMNKIGRKNTVILSLFFTLIGLTLPIIHYNLISIIISFSFIGIGNTLMQVSVNPLVSNIIGHKTIAPILTLGQFLKSISSFIAPIIAIWGSLYFDNWRLLFVVFAIEAFIAITSLWLIKIPHEKINNKQCNFKDIIYLLTDKQIFMYFIAIICYVGINSGTNVSAPRIIMDKLDIGFEEAGHITSFYFLFRIIGCFIGTFVLAFCSMKKFFTTCLIIIITALIGLCLFNNELPLYTCIAFIGLSVANIFSIILSQALLYRPKQTNEISALMITGLSGAVIFLPFMGFCADIFGSQDIVPIIMMIGTLYLFYVSNKLN